MVKRDRGKDIKGFQGTDEGMPRKRNKLSDMSVKVILEFLDSEASKDYKYI